MDLAALLEQGQALATASVVTAALTVEALKALVSCRPSLYVLCMYVCVCVCVPC